MPPTPKKPAMKSTQEPTVIYPVLEAKIFQGDTAITYAQMKDILGWETEDEYKERIKLEKGETAKEFKVGFGEEYLLKDLAGKRVRCSNNSKNRPFKEPWARALAQDILLSGPGLPVHKRRFQVNGEPVIIGRYGSVISAQHRGCAFMLAVQEWRKNPERWKFSWPTEPVFETFASLGVSEEDYVVRTLDNVQPRSLADVLYTSDLFAKVTGSVERKDLTRVLASAVDLLWDRTGNARPKSLNATAQTETRYQTIGESCEFLDRHKAHLLMYVKHCFDEDKERSISVLKLSVGHVACLQYLFACSKSDPVEYGKTRSEKGLNFDLDKEATQFVVRLAMKPEHAPDFQPLRSALASLVEEQEGGRAPEKRALLVKAWNLYIQGKPLTTAGLALSYDTDDNGVKHMTNRADIIAGGIDKGDYPDKPQGPTPEDIELEKARIRKETADKLLAKIKENAEKRGVPTNGAPPAPPKPATPPKPVPAPTPAKPPSGKKPPTPLRGGTGK